MNNSVGLTLAGLVQNITRNPELIQAVIKTGLLGNSDKFYTNDNLSIVAELAIKFIKSGGPIMACF